MKGRSEDEKGGEHEELEDQGRFEERAARLSLGFGEGVVGGVGGAVGGQGFDDGAEAAEGGDDAAWVQGGVVGDVVEDAAEDDVVC